MRPVSRVVARWLTASLDCVVGGLALVGGSLFAANAVLRAGRRGQREQGAIDGLHA
jgi:hypothetical protein